MLCYILLDSGTFYRRRVADVLIVLITKHFGAASEPLTHVSDVTADPIDTATRSIIPDEERRHISTEHAHRATTVPNTLQFQWFKYLNLSNRHINRHFLYLALLCSARFQFDILHYNSHCQR